MLQIIKLGGSLAQSADLAVWLHVVVRWGAGNCVLVPGGGLFADAVRQIQTRWRFSDSTAHHMALLAMVQYGLLLGEFSPDITPVSDEPALQAALSADRVPVWLPLPMVLQDATMEQSWRVSSDSLAIWLARRLGAERLLVIKSLDAPEQTLSALVASRFVDEAFVQYARCWRGQIFFLGPGCQYRLARSLRTGEPPGPAAIK